MKGFDVPQEHSPQPHLQSQNEKCLPAIPRSWFSSGKDESSLLSVQQRRPASLAAHNKYWLLMQGDRKSVSVLSCYSWGGACEVPFKILAECGVLGHRNPLTTPLLPSFILQLPLPSSVLFLQLIYVSLSWLLPGSVSVVDTIDHFGCWQTTEQYQ